MRIPYGYRREGLRFVANEFAPIVQEIFKLRRLSALAIATHLNSMGIVSPGGKQWHAKTVIQILENPIYVGGDPDYDGLFTPEPESLDEFMAKQEKKSLLERVHSLARLSYETSNQDLDFDDEFRAKWNKIWALLYEWEREVVKAERIYWERLRKMKTH